MNICKATLFVALLALSACTGADDNGADDTTSRNAAPTSASADPDSDDVTPDAETTEPDVETTDAVVDDDDTTGLRSSDIAAQYELAEPDNGYRSVLGAFDIDTTTRFVYVLTEPGLDQAEVLTMLRELRGVADAAPASEQRRVVNHYFYDDDTNFDALMEAEGQHHLAMLAYEEGRDAGELTFEDRPETSGELRALRAAGSVSSSAGYLGGSPLMAEYFFCQLQPCVSKETPVFGEGS